ncbi:MAG: TIGR03118 family protein [Rhizomicrobium sp.]
MRTLGHSLSALLLSAAVFGAAHADALSTGSAYTVTPLVSDQAGMAPNVDPNLVNAWGLAQDPTGALWVSDAGTGVSTLYDRQSGAINSLVVNIPMGGPTGIVAPLKGGFDVSENGSSGSSIFLFDTLSGAIEGWNPGVDPNNAIVAVDNSANGSVYTGLALDKKTNLLFAADNKNNQVQVFDKTFNPVATFTDPSLPKGYAPHNVAALNGKIYVAFAKLGGGGGYVDVFDTSGALLTQLIAKKPLNAPWGLTIAPKKFGAFASDLLVGNLGDGKIHAFDPVSGALLGTLSDAKGKPLKIDGLWALDNGPGNDTVTFSSGPGGYAHGLVGLIKSAN